MAGAFQDIKFGRAAAENEHNYRPGLLSDAFLDDEKLVDTLVRDPQYFVILGPKGSGKSAIGYRIELLEKRYNVNARVFRLDDFPFDAFSRILDWPGETEEFVFRQNWELMLGLCFWHIHQREEQRIVNTAFDPGNVLKLMRDLNIEASTDLAAVTKRIVARRAGFQYKGAGGDRSTTEEREPLPLVALRAMLSEYAFKTSPAKPIRIVIDGLDDNLAFIPSQLKCLTALLLAVSKMNAEFIQNRVDAKVIVLCRDDVWQAMESNNLQRIRDDNSIQIEWYREGQGAENSRLVELVNLRATTSLKRRVDVAKDFLPRKIGWASTWGPTMKTFLDHTRHVPRDLINILNSVQDAMGVSDIKPNEDQIRAGLKKFCDNHFEGEIRNTLRGLLPDAEIPIAMDLLAAIPKQEFTALEAHDWMKKNRGSEVSESAVHRMLAALYAACAVGHVWLDDNGKRRLAFRYRNPSSRYNPRFHVYVHPALFKALHGDIHGFVYHPLQETLALASGRDVSS